MPARRRCTPRSSCAVERFFEGDRPQRMKLDAGPWNAQPHRGASSGKQTARGSRWPCWTGITFVGYFTPIRDADPRRHRRVVAGFVGDLLDAVLRVRHLRQRRLHARAGLQVHVPVRALPERDVRSRHADHQLRQDAAATRAARARARSTRRSQGLGDCIDCGLCVQVCPTGIDIRNGLQYECIGCAACIDVCDGVMDKMRYPRGLVRYVTQHGQDGHWSRAQMWQRRVPARGC